ncbi:hypothetical protein [Pseudomonas laurylsulfatiphila]|uniref:hypothetical protein n=1 Tax=Pseudomonas laurylsulfatiphila TaxID=2011015 RepID=UPI003D241A5D
MFEISSKSADQIFVFSNLMLIIGSIIVLAATATSMMADRIRDKYAEERQSQNEVTISKADERAATANLQAAQANERALVLEKETATLQKQAEEAKAETAKVNERIKQMQHQRRLTEDQTNAIKLLMNHEVFQQDKSINFRVGSVPDVESQVFAMEFMEIFKSCGINIFPTPDGKFPVEFLQNKPTPHGLALVVSDQGRIEAKLPFFTFHKIALEIGLDVNVEIDPKLRENEAILVVMKKPVVA